MIIVCLCSVYRPESASADQDNLKYSTSRERGNSASYGSHTSSSAGVSRQKHDDIRVSSDLHNEEEGMEFRTV